jgi:hypothetical protein
MRTGQTRRYFWLEAAALLTAAALAAMLVEPALGQVKAPGVSAPCSPSLPPGAPGTTTTGEGEQRNPAPPPDNLSNRLAQSDGVICPPPAVDPEIRLPTPETGRTPVIPPPGSPGGDPSVRPK